MEQKNELKINEDVLCVLKHATDSNLVMVDNELIERPLDKDFDELIKIFEQKDLGGYHIPIDASIIIEHIINHPTLSVLLGMFDYCIGKLDTPYNGYYSTLETIKATYPSNFDSYHGYEFKVKARNMEKERLLTNLKGRLKAYYLQETYKKCEALRIANIVLAYSHRKVGWSIPNYILNENFSVEIKTNFGYGYVSYFFTRIKYKEIEIIPFSDWIIYEKAELFEIVRYSSKHSLKDESWLDALEYARDACNLAQTNEEEFVKRYMIEECEKMVSGLEGFLHGDTFKFLNMEKIYTDSHKSGRNLIEFRGEKISGSLSFIERIISFRKVTEITEFVKRIEECNKQVQPFLINELELLSSEIQILKTELDLLKPIYETLYNENIMFENLRQILKKELIIAKELHYIDFDQVEFDKRFSIQNPSYINFQKKFEQKTIEFNNLNAQILSMVTAENNIKRYNETIQSYFQEDELHKIEEQVLV